MVVQFFGQGLNSGKVNIKKIEYQEAIQSRIELGVDIETDNSCILFQVLLEQYWKFKMSRFQVLNDFIQLSQIANFQ